MNTLEWLLLTTLSLLWGATFLFAKVAIAEVPPLTLVFARVGIAAAILGVVLAALGRGLPRGRNVWLAFLGMGLLNNVIPFGLIFWGQAWLTAGFASILNATTPLFTVVVAHILTSDERATPAKIAGGLIGFAGVALMLAPGRLAGAEVWPPAALAVLGGALCYSFAGVFGRRFRRMGVDPVHSAFGQLAASTAIMAVLCAAIDRPWASPLPSAPVLAAVLALGSLSTALAYVLYFRILATAGATNLMLVTLLMPVSAILLGAVVLGERLQAAQMSGMALIGLGLVVIDGRLARWLPPRSAALSPVSPPPGTRPPPSRRPDA